MCSLLLNKFFALNFGEQGITLLAHFQNLLSIPVLISNEGIAKGLVKQNSKQKISLEEQKTFFGVAFWLNIILFVVVSLVLIFGREVLLNRFVGDYSYGFWLVCFLPFLLLNFFNLLFIAIFLSRNKIKIYALVAVVNNLIAVSLLYGLEELSFENALLTYHFASGLAFFITFSIALRKIPFSYFKISPFPTNNSFKKILKYVVAALSIAIFDRVGNFILRAYIIDEFDYYQTGLWQASLKLSDSYTQVFTATFLVLFFPKVVSLIKQKAVLRKFLAQSVLFLIPVAILGLSVVYFYRGFFLELMFDTSFAAAEYMMIYVLIADFFRFGNYFLGHLLLAQERMRLFVILQAVFSIQFFVMAYIFSTIYGIIGLLFAYLLSYFISVIVLLVSNKSVFVGSKIKIQREV